MSFNHYYQSELTALRQLGQRFAQRSPALAPFLGQAGQDPDVERLLEGFAFLTGRLRQKLDDELPELTHSLMQLLWPNYMRPLPAFSIIQFDSLAEPGLGRWVERDAAVESEPIDGMTCHFRTCYRTEVQALNLSALTYSLKGDGALLSLRLQVSGSGKGHMGEVGLRRLRLHFAGERYISQMLYLSMLRNLNGIELIPLSAAGAQVNDEAGNPLSFSLSSDEVQPVGFAEDEALIPYPLNTFRGYRYLQEYFAFQDKFLFVDVNGLELLQALPQDELKKIHGLQLRFDIRKSGTQRIRPTLDNVKLHCTPIVNLFKHDASPIALNGKQSEYLVLPANYDLKSCGVFSVENVRSKAGGEDYREFVPFESFEHDPSFDSPHSQPHYSVRQRPSLLHGGLDTYLSFGLSDAHVGATASIELTCTNQNLPRKLSLGDIRRSSNGESGALGFRNITLPTSSFAPPLNRNFLWKLISNMSLNYLSLADVDALKVILETYDLPRYYDQHAERVSKRLLGGLKSIGHTRVDRLYRGLPVRGLRTELIIDREGYVGEGDLFLFASVLNEFFALYASLNSYHELKVTSTQGEEYEWTPRMGLQPLL